MPISRRRSGIDITALTPFNKELSAVVGTGSFQTILSITGKGFLDSFYMRTTNVNGSIRITVDGIVKVLLTTVTNNHYIGVATHKEIVAHATAGLSVLRVPASTNLSGSSSIIAALKSYPVTDGSDGMIILGDSKIYFTQSLLLEISGNTGGTAYEYLYSGGYQ